MELREKQRVEWRHSGKSQRNDELKIAERKGDNGKRKTMEKENIRREKKKVKARNIRARKR